MNEQPRTIQEDQDTLETIRTIALEFLNRKETRSQGEALWRVFTFLEDRLSRIGAGNGNFPAQPGDQEIPETVKEVIEKAEGKVCLFLNCRIESLRVNGGGKNGGSGKGSGQARQIGTH